MKKLIVLSLLICLLTGCLTPSSFRHRYGNKSGRYTTYNVTDYKNGFKIDMTYYKPDPGGTGGQTIFEAREKIKELAGWIAKARKRKIRPIKMGDIDSGGHFHHIVTQYTTWRGSLRVYYTDK
jgi:hypothetical protein